MASLWEAFSNYLKSQAFITFLESSFKSVILRVLKAQAFGGVKAWILSFVAKEMAEDAVIYIVNPLIREANYGAEIIKGNIIVKKMANATDYDEWSRNAHKL